ncbi:MAG TPA: inner membrane CreD family protein [Thermoanaerobaculia bacterium]|nr:inner membrane CreD family protein [Thermoanaerobaculia bacterium]
MGRNVMTIVAIFIATSVAWLVLGGSIENRTYSAGKDLADQVGATWGTPQKQAPPSAWTTRITTTEVEETVNNVVTKKKVGQPVNDPLPIERSRVRVSLDLEQRQKGLLWFPTYRVSFAGDYVFRNTTASDQVSLKFPFPAPDAIYDDVVLRVDGQPVPLNTAGGTVLATVRCAPGAAMRVETGYRSQGMQHWHYSFGENVSQVRDFVLEMQTNFRAIDFPQGTLSPTLKEQTPRDWHLTWKYANLVTGYQIGMVLPEKLQPGPLAGRISYFAPVSLLFFFFLMFIITRMRGIALHPMHYFFLATSFFAFHLLLAYLVDHISIHAAFAICSAVSIFLVVSYLRVVVGPRFAFVEAALAQFVYLVLFSYAFFFKGFTGLAITIGAIATLFAVMQLTARIDWAAEEAMA